MSIDNITKKIKDIKDSHRETLINILIVLVIILVASGSFGLGRLSKIKESNEDIAISNPENNGLENSNQVASVASAGILNSESSVGQKLAIQNQATKSSPEGKQFVASKNGTKYYFTWCSGAGRIKEENKVYFSTREEAEKAGLEKSSTYKGL